MTNPKFVDNNYSRRAEEEAGAIRQCKAELTNRGLAFHYACAYRPSFAGLAPFRDCRSRRGGNRHSLSDPRPLPPSHFPCLERPYVQCWSEGYSLSKVTADFVEPLPEPYVFNTLCNDLHAEFVCKQDASPNHLPMIRILIAVLNKGLINLQLTKGHAREGCQRRVTGAEIIQRNPHSPQP